MVVDTLGPARRRTHGLCVTVRCQWKKKDRLDADLWTGTFAHTGLKSNASNIHLLKNLLLLLLLFFFSSSPSPLSSFSSSSSSSIIVGLLGAPLHCRLYLGVGWLQPSRYLAMCPATEWTRIQRQKSRSKLPVNGLQTGFPRCHQ